MAGIIKVCGDPGCDAVWHNVPKDEKHCKDCGGTIKMINQETYLKKFADSFFQYDFNSHDYYRPEKEIKS